MIEGSFVGGSVMYGLNKQDVHAHWLALIVQIDSEEAQRKQQNAAAFLAIMKGCKLISLIKSLFPFGSVLSLSWEAPDLVAYPVSQPGYSCFYA